MTHTSGQTTDLGSADYGPGRPIAPDPLVHPPAGSEVVNPLAVEARRLSAVCDHLILASPALEDQVGRTSADGVDPVIAGSRTNGVWAEPAFDQVISSSSSKDVAAPGHAPAGVELEHVVARATTN